MMLNHAKTCLPCNGGHPLRLPAGTPIAFALIYARRGPPSATMMMITFAIGASRTCSKTAPSPQGVRHRSRGRSVQIRQSYPWHLLRRPGAGGQHWSRCHRAATPSWSSSSTGCRGARADARYFRGRRCCAIARAAEAWQTVTTTVSASTMLNPAALASATTGPAAAQRFPQGRCCCRRCWQTMHVFVPMLTP